MGISIRRIANLVGLGLIVLVAAVFVAALQGCMATEPTNPTSAQVDSGRKVLDSINAGQPVKLHGWQICAAAPAPEPTCPACVRDSFEWVADMIIGRDSIAFVYNEPGATCAPFGIFADTAHVQLDAFTRNSSVDSVWFQMDGVDSVRYWMPWRQVVLHPDSMRKVADSVARVNAKGLSKGWAW